MDLHSDSFDRRRQVFKNIWNKNAERTPNQKVQFAKPKVIKTMKQSSGSVDNKNRKVMRYEEKFKRLSQACNKILKHERKTGNNEFIEMILGPQSSPKRKRRKKKSKKRNVHEELYQKGNLKLREKTEPLYYNRNRYKHTVVEDIEESITDLHGLEYDLLQKSRNIRPHPNSALSRISFSKRKVIPPVCVTEYTGFRSPKKPALIKRNFTNNAITLAMTRSIRTLFHPKKKELNFTYYTMKLPEI